VQPPNARAPILVIDDGNDILDKLIHLKKHPTGIARIVLLPIKLTVDKFIQSVNANMFIVFIVGGIFIC
jgi:hypothetical protein